MILDSGDDPCRNYRTIHRVVPEPIGVDVQVLNTSINDHHNSVPLNPMVNDQISLLNGYNWGYTPFSDIPMA